MKSREIDMRIAKEVLGYEVWSKNKVLHERAPKGERPLRYYSRDMEYAWEVAEKMNISLISIQGGQWFAFAGPFPGWASPNALLQYLEGKDFSGCGAGFSESAAAAICEAALKVMDKRALTEKTSDRHVIDSIQNMDMESAH